MYFWRIYATSKRKPSRYRFTTRESTPDDQSVDPDPELLGRVFENLYQGDERHDTGTYYTPREMVPFACSVYPPEIHSPASTIRYKHTEPAGQQPQQRFVIFRVEHFVR